MAYNRSSFYVYIQQITVYFFSNCYCTLNSDEWNFMHWPHELNTLQRAQFEETDAKPHTTLEHISNIFSIMCCNSSHPRSPLLLAGTCLPVC